MLFTLFPKGANFILYLYLFVNLKIEILSILQRNLSVFLQTHESFPEKDGLEGILF